MIESPAELTRVEIRPNVGMLALLSSMNYKPWYALSELVDNALASFLGARDLLAEHGQGCVTVDIRIDRAAGTIEVVDDAAGIAGDAVARAFRPAEPPPDRSGLGQFGIGMKSAACWFADEFEVTSTAIGEPVRRTVAFDVPAIVRRQLETLPLAERHAEPHEHGTIVRLTRLHRQPPTGRTLGKIRKYLASIYRSFLRSGELVLTIGGERLAAPEATILDAPRWDRSAAPSQMWRKDVEVELADGVRVHGWLGLRARGSTSESGLALMHRGKVVVGAGGGAGGTEDLYRPVELFGASTSFVFQRLVGELDVSALPVTSSKDGIIWDGHEADLLMTLREVADEEPLPLLRMARLFRATERGPDVDRSLESALAATARAAAAYLAAPAPAAPEPAPSVLPREEVSRTLTWSIPSASAEVTLSVVLRDGSSWLRVWDRDDSYVIEVDREHPFMQAFAHLPNQQIEPVLRLAAALGLAEIEARIGGAPQPSAVRMQLNRILRGPLSRVTIEDAE